MNLIDGILSTLDKLERRLLRLESQGQGKWVYLTAPLTSTSWDGDAYSTTGKTKIDLSSVFSAPAGIKAVDVRIGINDSASATSDVWFILSPNDTAGQGMAIRIQGLTNDAVYYSAPVVPCDSNGDVYYQCQASGAGTLDCRIEIWGYLL